MTDLIKFSICFSAFEHAPRFLRSLIALRLVPRLEDPDAEEVKEFVQEQVKLTESVLQKCDTREKLRAKITELFDHPRYEPPFKRGNKYFYNHNTGLQAQSVLYVQVCGRRIQFRLFSVRSLAD